MNERQYLPLVIIISEAKHFHNCAIVWKRMTKDWYMNSIYDHLIWLHLFILFRFMSLSKDEFKRNPVLFLRFFIPPRWAVASSFGRIAIFRGRCRKNWKLNVSTFKMRAWRRKKNWLQNKQEITKPQNVHWIYLKYIRWMVIRVLTFKNRSSNSLE